MFNSNLIPGSNINSNLQGNLNNNLMYPININAHHNLNNKNFFMNNPNQLYNTNNIIQYMQNNTLQNVNSENTFINEYLNNLKYENYISKINNNPINFNKSRTNSNLDVNTFFANDEKVSINSSANKPDDYINSPKSNLHKSLLANLPKTKNNIIYIDPDSQDFTPKNKNNDEDLHLSVFKKKDNVKVCKRKDNISHKKGTNNI